jgi:short-subunit dehydrogenase
MSAAQSVPEYLKTFSTVVVTGASSGIGEGYVKAIAKINSGAQFINLSRTIPRISLDGGRLQHIQADLGTAEGQEAAMAVLEARLAGTGTKGRLLLINNSGFGSYGNFPEPGLENCLRMLDLNARAPMLLTGRLLPMLKERGGAVVNIASIAAFQPTPLMSVYGATKAFLLNWSLGLSQDLRETGVRVLCVCPGPTSTNFFQAAGFDEPPVPGWLGQTTDAVVEESLKALAAGKPLLVCGIFNKLQVAISSRIPKVLVSKLARQSLEKVRAKPLAQQRLKPKPAVPEEVAAGPK